MAAADAKPSWRQRLSAFSDRTKDKLRQARLEKAARESLSALHVVQLADRLLLLQQPAGIDFAALAAVLQQQYAERYHVIDAAVLRQWGCPSDTFAGRHTLVPLVYSQLDFFVAVSVAASDWLYSHPQHVVLVCAAEASGPVLAACLLHMMHVTACVREVAPLLSDDRQHQPQQQDNHADMVDLDDAVPAKRVLNAPVIKGTALDAYRQYLHLSTNALTARLRTRALPAPTKRFLDDFTRVVHDRCVRLVGVVLDGPGAHKSPQGSADKRLDPLDKSGVPRSLSSVSAASASLSTAPRKLLLKAMIMHHLPQVSPSGCRLMLSITDPINRFLYSSIQHGGGLRWIPTSSSDPPATVIAMNCVVEGMCSLDNNHVWCLSSAASHYI